MKRKQSLLWWRIRHPRQAWWWYKLKREQRIAKQNAGYTSMTHRQQYEWHLSRLGERVVSK